MNLEAFNNKQLQDIRAFLVLKQRAGVSTEAAIKLIEEVSIQELKILVKEPTVCPSCGKPTWAIKRFADGVRRWWCNSCTYSKGI